MCAKDGAEPRVGGLSTEEEDQRAEKGQRRGRKDGMSFVRHVSKYVRMGYTDARSISPTSGSRFVRPGSKW